MLDVNSEEPSKSYYYSFTLTYFNLYDKAVLKHFYKSEIAETCWQTERQRRDRLTDNVETNNWMDNQGHALYVPSDLYTYQFKFPWIVSICTDWTQNFMHLSIMTKCDLD